MARSIKPRLQDILTSIATVEAATEHMDLAAFAADPILRLATERAIEIVSEAARHIPKELLGKHPDVPWRNIIAIGNKLRHEYHRVDIDIIWEIVIKHLPELRPVVETMLTELP